MFFMFGTVTTAFTDYVNPISVLTTEQKEERLTDAINEFVWQMCALGAGLWVFHYFFVTCLNYAAERQVLRIRKQFFVAILRQDVGWYDTSTTTDFASRMSEDLNKIQDGLGEKMGMFLRFFWSFLFSFGIAFFQNWELSLVLCAVVPLLIIIGIVFGKIITTYSKHELDVYGQAGKLADEVLSSIRTVVAFGGQEKEVENYRTEITKAQKSGIRRGFMTAMTMGLMFGVMYGTYGLGFWYGVKQYFDQQEEEEWKNCSTDCIKDNFENPSNIADCILDCFDFNPGTISTALFGILQGGMQIGQSNMFAEAFNTARAAAAQIFMVIDRQPPIDSSSLEGAHPTNIHGNIIFRNVSFNYPSRPNINILNDLNLTIPAGKSVALVGPSGCGKSTCIQLIQRFYDPINGDILLDGTDIKQLNVGALRKNIGIVGQEPVLFDCSIKENIKYAKPDATDEEIWQACRESNAEEFISKLPSQLDTFVGEGGAQLSGGQKQRIAIARALIRKPKILLLDEATSALDNNSEKVVQTALDKVQEGRTTVIVAHRLTTIKHADLIVTFDNGRVKEQGSHKELMELKGLYYSLVMRQVTDDDNTTDDDKKKKIMSKQRSIAHDDYVEIPKNAKKKDAKKYGNLKLFRMLLSLNSPEAVYLIIGLICSTGFGLTNAGFAVLFGDVFNIFSEEDVDEARKTSVYVALQFGGLGLFTMVCMLGQGFMFSIAGEKLTKRVRTKMFRAMLSQEIGWFDLEENNSGALCSRLSTNAQTVQSATGNKTGQICQSISGLLAGLGLALYYNWKVGLVSNAFVPLIVIGMLYQMLMFTKIGAVQRTALETSAKLAVEAIKNIRTVAGLGCEPLFIELYNKELVKPHKKSLRSSHVRGMVFGFANSSFTFAYATCFAYGSQVYMDLYPPESSRIFEIWKIAVAVLSGSMMIGMSMSFLMDFGQVFIAADGIFQLLERKPKIDSDPAAGLLLSAIKGNFLIQDAEFEYPSRPDIKILKGLSMSISQGDKIALVGQSGCGKSTVIQLLQRLYDVEQGNIAVEAHDIRQLNLPNVRYNIGLVSQEPVLFNRTIAENIMYGNNKEVPSMEEVISAARAANIHNFVASLPEGYDTSVGGKGTQLSGGQKQRVAIARALVRYVDINKCSHTGMEV